MSRMVRKQIYIESRQDTTLKKQAKIFGITEAEIIRQAIDRQMASVRLDVRDLKACVSGIAKGTKTGIGGSFVKQDRA